MSFLDPIQRLIDWQLRCRWPGEDQVPQQSTIGENYVEERIVEALDEKYCGITNRDYSIYGMYREGYSQEDIGLLHGISQQAVSKRLKFMRRWL